MKKCFLLLLLSSLLIGCYPTDYQYQKKKPAGISLSFDDRTVHEWFELREIFNAHDFHVTLFITQFDSLSLDELNMLRILKNDGHEIGSHGHIHLISEYFIKAHSLDEYMHTEIIPSIRAMTINGFTPTSFAYPYGSKYHGTDKELLKYFYVLRSVAPLNAERDLTLMDEIYYSFDGKRTISALGIDKIDKVSLDMIRKGFQRAKNKKEIIFLYGHAPEEDHAQGYTFDKAFLIDLITLADSMNLKSYTISEIFL